MLIGSLKELIISAGWHLSAPFEIDFLKAPLSSVYVEELLARVLDGCSFGKEFVQGSLLLACRTLGGSFRQYRALLLPRPLVVLLDLLEFF